MKSIGFFALALLVPFSANANDDILKPFPAAQKDHQRYVISVPNQSNENLYKVEIVAGQTLQTDCNTKMLAGDLTEKNLEGWGYSYYELTSPKGPATTLMGCPPGSEKQAFVAMRGDGYWLRYNSKMPIVVYAPKDVEVHYRIWQGRDTPEPAPKG